MNMLLGGLSFLNPWILAGLAALPVLWFLLRVTPPAPVHIILPTARFLEGLVPERKTPSKTPWWILLLRLLIAALVIAALAHPVMNKARTLQGAGPVRLVFDNGWEAAQIWQNQINAANEIVTQAGRENREIWILTTAPSPVGSNKPLNLGPLSASEASARIKGLEPHPWQADYNAVASAAKERSPATSTETHWLGTGIGGAGFNELVKTLQSGGQLIYVRPADKDLPLLLRPAETGAGKIGAVLDAPPAIPAGLPTGVQILSGTGQVLDDMAVTLSPDKLPLEVTFSLPPELRRNIARMKIRGRNSAGTVHYFGAGDHYRTAGIITGDGQNETAPLVESSYYLTRALEPFASVSPGKLDEILGDKPSILFLPDTGSITASDLNQLENWVREGGLLVRFAGPNMASSETGALLTPVDLRLGGRAMEGSLTWEQPAALAPFPETSPLYGIEIPPDVMVRQQILAEPSPELDEKTWARLEDGTPLITAGPLGDGLLVLVHTTAGPDWSDLPLSGLYVHLLKRLVDISANPQAATNIEGVLQPLSVMDGFGQLVQPPASVKPIPAEEFDQLMPGPLHPPGIYGRAGYRVALNLGERLEKLPAPPRLPISIGERRYEHEYETDLRPPLLVAATLLFLLDWLLILLMSAGVGRLLLRRAAPALLVLCLAAPAHAASQRQVTLAGEAHLGYMRTGDPAVDTTSERGLRKLGEVMAARTSAEPAGVTALTPESPDLPFFSLIYWPLTPDQQPLSESAQRNVQAYLDNGGTILFDTRDRNYASGGTGLTRNAESLQKITASLDIPALSPMPDEHVLSRSFYLLDTMPGRFEGGTIWVEERSTAGRDGVSSVIIGGHDWASAWAAEGSGGSLSPHLAGGARQRELAYRFGINLLMYALTGNYKADQVHIPHILRRLGQ